MLPLGTTTSSSGFNLLSALALPLVTLLAALAAIDGVGPLRRKALAAGGANLGWLRLLLLPVTLPLLRGTVQLTLPLPLTLRVHGRVAQGA